MRQIAFFPLACTCARVHLYYYYQAPSIRFSIIIRQLLYDPASASAAVGGLEGQRARSPGRRPGHFGMARPALKGLKPCSFSAVRRCTPFLLFQPPFCPLFIDLCQERRKSWVFLKKKLLKYLAGWKNRRTFAPAFEKYTSRER